jgi:hypothetical protein
MFLKLPLGALWTELLTTIDRDYSLISVKLNFGEGNLANCVHSGTQLKVVFVDETSTLCSVTLSGVCPALHATRAYQLGLRA